MAFMMNKLAMINSCEIILEKKYFVFVFGTVCADIISASATGTTIS
jgi:hypothetical protein